MPTNKDVSLVIARRINDIIAAEPTSRSIVVGPPHDPHEMIEATVAGTSALGRFLTKKGYVGKSLVAGGKHHTTVIYVSAASRPAEAFRLRTVTV